MWNLRRLLVTRWLPITYILVITESNSRNMFKHDYLKNSKHFLQYLFNFCNLHKMQRILQKKMSFILSIFQKIVTPRNMVTWMPASSSLRTPFVSQPVLGWQKLLISARHNFHSNFPLSQDKLNYKTSLLLRCEILALFGNTLTANHMYSCHYWEKLLQHAPTPLCQKL